MFKVGDLAVYPALGVGRIEAVESKEIGDCTITCYVLKILDKDTMVFIPTDNAESVGLRRIIHEDEVQRVFSILMEDCALPTGLTWNRRYREYLEKMKSGSIYDIAEVLRDLVRLQNGKDLSFGERRMLDNAKELIIRELSIAKKVSHGELEAELEAILIDRL
jgi:CarD family transcriptional regulator